MSDIENDQPYTDSNGIEHDPGDWPYPAHTYNPVEGSYWIKQAVDDATNGVPARTDVISVVTAYTTATGIPFNPVYNSYQSDYTQQYKDTQYQLSILENEGGNTPVEGV